MHLSDTEEALVPGNGADHMLLTCNFWQVSIVPERIWGPATLLNEKPGKICSAYDTRMCTLFRLQGGE